MRLTSDAGFVGAGERSAVVADEVDRVRYLEGEGDSRDVERVKARRWLADVEDGVGHIPHLEGESKAGWAREDGQERRRPGRSLWFVEEMQNEPLGQFIASHLRLACNGPFPTLLA